MLYKTWEPRQLSSGEYKTIAADTGKIGYMEPQK